ncbi:penicillin acylase family protein [Nocardioides sp. HDW12B]|uniref:penicillin acylase family protein n=1 Tax=Nocardioides sp. HDW12B TaxID=2714939 RepID=UPI00140E4B26|nr:penicillin acylase family protein [Nocardioides sp. HDW12B]QIK65496.1 penicillin acylase family protein [Nocardioides sp. HDW12B]
MAEAPAGATTRRGAHGIPHVVAGSLLAVAREQGRAVVEDRLWQVTWSRLKAEGRTAELVGPPGLPWDRFARRAGVADVAQQANAALGPESRAFVAAYVDGVNEALAAGPTCAELEEVGHRAEAWPAWMPLAVFAAHHVLFGTFPGKLWRRHLRATVGDDVAGLFRHEGLGPGSNSWVVGGQRTAGGFPMIGGDPHRGFELPNGYQQVRLTSTDPDDAFDVAGFTFPGVPGVQHFAHAGAVAWGITNATADYQDVYVEELERRAGKVLARTADGWVEVTSRLETVHVAGHDPETVEVVETPAGRVVQGEPGGTAYSLRTPSYALGDLGFEALVPLLRARSVADVERALEHWVEPVNNLLVADRAGTVRQRVVGRVPLRHDANRTEPVPAWDRAHRWNGWVTLPPHDVAPDGHLATANHRMYDDFERIGRDFAPPGRARRIEALLEGRDGLTRDDFAAIHADVLAGQPAALHRALAELSGLDGPAEQLRRRLVAWDQRFTADSTEGTAYVDVRTRLVSELARTPTLARLSEHEADPLLAPWFDVPTELWLSLPHVLSPCGRALLPEVDAALAEALAHVAGRPAEPWHRRHVYAPYHPLGRELPDAPGLAGDNDCVRCAGARPGSDLVLRGSVARYVWDLAGLEGSGWVVPLGADGDPRSAHHHDQLGTWVDGRLVPVGDPASDLSQPVVGGSGGS